MHASQKRKSSPNRTDTTPESGPAGAPRDGLAMFRARLAAGNYDAVLGRGLRNSLRDAATDTGLETEIGALRLTLARLLQEETNPSRLAAGVARVAGVAVQAARLRTNPDADFEELRSVLMRGLDTIESERVRDAGGEQILDSHHQ